MCAFMLEGEKEEATKKTHSKNTTVHIPVSPREHGAVQSVGNRYPLPKGNPPPLETNVHDR